MTNIKKSAAIAAAVSVIASLAIPFFNPQQNMQTSAASLSTEMKKAYPDSREVYNTLMSFESKYPQGTPWGNDKYFTWKGGTYSTGYGCAGFAFMLSDAAFGNLPAKFLRTFNPSTVQVGDILHYNNHFIVVLERASNGFIVAEGNVNQQVMWGRLITDAEIRANFEHHITRYPEVVLGDVNLDGKIDSSDSSVVLEDFALIQTGNSSLFNDSTKKAADVNKDGRADSVDASKILEYYGLLSTGRNPSWN